MKVVEKMNRENNQSNPVNTHIISPGLLQINSMVEVAQEIKKLLYKTIINIKDNVILKDATQKDNALTRDLDSLMLKIKDNVSNFSRIIVESSPMPNLTLHDVNKIIMNLIFSSTDCEKELWIADFTPTLDNLSKIRDVIKSQIYDIESLTQHKKNKENQNFFDLLNLTTTDRKNKTNSYHKIKIEDLKDALRDHAHFNKGEHGDQLKAGQNTLKKLGETVEKYCKEEKIKKQVHTAHKNFHSLAINDDIQQNLKNLTSLQKSLEKEMEQVKNTVRSNIETKQLLTQIENDDTLVKNHFEIIKGIYVKFQQDIKTLPKNLPTANLGKDYIEHKKSITRSRAIMNNIDKNQCNIAETCLTLLFAEEIFPANFTLNLNLISETYIHHERKLISDIEKSVMAARKNELPLPSAVKFNLKVDLLSKNNFRILCKDSVMGEIIMSGNIPKHHIIYTNLFRGPGAKIKYGSEAVSFKIISSFTEQNPALLEGLFLKNKKLDTYIGISPADSKDAAKEENNIVKRKAALAAQEVRKEKIVLIIHPKYEQSSETVYIDINKAEKLAISACQLTNEKLKRASEQSLKSQKDATDYFTFHQSKNIELEANATRALALLEQEKKNANANNSLVKSIKNAFKLYGDISTVFNTSVEENMIYPNFNGGSLDDYKKNNILPNPHVSKIKDLVTILTSINKHYEDHPLSWSTKVSLDHIFSAVYLYNGKSSDYQIFSPEISDIKDFICIRKKGNPSDNTELSSNASIITTTTNQDSINKKSYPVNHSVLMDNISTGFVKIHQLNQEIKTSMTQVEINHLTSVLTYHLAIVIKRCYKNIFATLLPHYWDIKASRDSFQLYFSILDKINTNNDDHFQSLTEIYNSELKSKYPAIINALKEEHLFAQIINLIKSENKNDYYEKISNSLSGENEKANIQKKMTALQEKERISKDAIESFVKKQYGEKKGLPINSHHEFTTATKNDIESTVVHVNLLRKSLECVLLVLPEIRTTSNPDKLYENDFLRQMNGYLLGLVTQFSIPEGKKPYHDMIPHYSGFISELSADKKSGKFQTIEQSEYIANINTNTDKFLSNALTKYHTFSLSGSDTHSQN